MSVDLSGSSTIQIYEGSGVGKACLDALERELINFLDTRQYRVERFSKNSGRLSSDRPVSAIVIPGGNAVSMADELKELSISINRFLQSGVSAYLSCAGAIATGSQVVPISPCFPAPKRYMNMSFSTGIKAHDIPTLVPYYTPDKSVEMMRSFYNYTVVDVEHTEQVMRENAKQVHQFYHAFGPGFNISSQNRDYELLATYKTLGNFSNEENQADVVATCVKKLTNKNGLLFTGIHPELNVEDLASIKEVLGYNSDKSHYEKLVLSLTQNAAVHQKVLKSYFEQIGLKLK